MDTSTTTEAVNLAALRHHVTGAIERGEKQPIAGVSSSKITFGPENEAKAAALRVVAALEISRRVVAARGDASDRLDRAEAIARFMEPRALGLEVEKVWVLVLDRKLRLRRCCELTSGTATAALLHPRETLRAVLREGGTAFAVVHNHPSGDPAPSAADLQVTRQIDLAARAVDIQFCDHVVIGRAGADPAGRGFYSFREAGML